MSTRWQASDRLRGCASAIRESGLSLTDTSQYVVIDGGVKSAMRIECKWLTFEGEFPLASAV
jgi:hypothetical protein